MTVDLGTTALCAQTSQENQFWLGTPRTFIPLGFRDTNGVIHITENEYVSLNLN